MAIFRFIEEPSTVNLDMRNLNGWYVAEGLDLGGTKAIRKYLKQDGVDGAELVKSWLDIVAMKVPLILTPQSSSSVMLGLLDDLNAELRKPHNVIEYLPHGLTGTSFLMDTFRADEVSIADGTNVRIPWSVPGDGHLFEIQIERQPIMRGRGSVV